MFTILAAAIGAIRVEQPDAAIRAIERARSLPQSAGITLALRWLNALAIEQRSATDADRAKISDLLRACRSGVDACSSQS
jgi:hypothetical protein